MPFWAYAALHASWSKKPSKRECRTAPRTFSILRKQAGDFLRDYIRPGDAVLFKGSRGVQVEKAIDRAFETRTGAEARQDLTAMLYWLLYEQLYPAVGAVPRLPLCDGARHVRQPHFALPLRAARTVADPQAARISDRPAHSRRRPEIAPEESRHADHGRRSDRDHASSGPLCSGPI